MVPQVVEKVLMRLTTTGVPKSLLQPDLFEILRFAEISSCEFQNMLNLMVTYGSAV